VAHSHNNLVCHTSAYTWHVWRHHESLLGRILLFGLATGWAELLADRRLLVTYRNTPMLGKTPWYIIGGEFLIVLSLPAVISLLEKRRRSVSISAGICQGLWIW
jgi:hypothetical protein